MPFTPFHFGPGALIKACAPRYVSFSVFLFTQVLIDCEPLYFMLRGEDPLHRFFHTYLGATLVALAAYALGRPLAGIALSWRRQQLEATRASWRSAAHLIPPGAAVAGAITGAYSHVFLDSFMHADIRPLAPFSEGNPLWLAISIDALELSCLAAGILGAIILGLCWLRSKNEPQ